MQPGTSIPEVDAQTLARQLRAGEVVLIDVREPQEFAAERIPGSISMPLSSFDPQKAAASGHDKPVVVSCQIGGRAGRAAEAMVAAGTKMPVLFRESLNGWKAAGLPTESGAPTT
jgi:rhodanese-related sulfurtransferase